MHTTGGLSWSWGCRQCGCTCILFADDFERADNTALGDDWDEEAGAWSIASGKLVTGDANARAAVARDVAQGQASGDVRFQVRSTAVTVTVESAGGQARIYAQRDASQEVYAQWEAGATDGELTIWVSTTLSGSAVLRHGPFVIPGRGAGVATRIRLCNRLTHADAGLEFDNLVRVHLIDPTTGLILFATGDVVAEEPLANTMADNEGHGVATGAVPSGQVRFDDYVVEQVDQQRAACPECKPACPCTHLCIGVPITCGPSVSPPEQGGWADRVVLPRIPLVHDEWLPIPHAVQFSACVNKNRLLCAWGLRTADPQVGGWRYFATLQQEADNHWYLNVAIIANAGGILGAEEDARWWRVDLGTSPPHLECLTWEALAVPRYPACDVEATLPPGGIDQDPIDDCVDLSQSLTATAGEECYGSYGGLGTCCGGVTIAQFLYATVFKNGGDHYGTQPLDKVFQTSDSYRYENGLVDPGIVHTLVCGADVGAQYTFKDQDTGVFHTVSLTVESCDPYLATGTLTTGGTTYSVEIRE